MEEIVIKDRLIPKPKGYIPVTISYDRKEKYPFSMDCSIQQIDFTEDEGKQIAEFILEKLGISITDLQREAFEAGRKQVIGVYNKVDYKYPSFDDYKNSKG